MPKISGKLEIIFLVLVFISDFIAAIMNDELDLLEIADRNCCGG